MRAPGVPRDRLRPPLPALSSFLGAALHGIGAVVFPSACLLCRRSLSHPLSGPLCPLCFERLPRIENPSCPRCGLPYPRGVDAGTCGPCRRGPRYFRRARALSPYLEEVRLCLHSLKYKGRWRLAGLLGTAAARRHVVKGELAGATAVVPVPLSRRRRRERGFNQAELIARAVAREAAIPLRPRALKRTKERTSQARLSAAARRENVASAFRARLPAALRGGSLLLIDDVFTTGATAEAAARALLAAGAESVDVLTLARVP